MTPYENPSRDGLTVMPSPVSRSAALWGCAVLAFYAALTMLLMYPLSLAPRSRALDLGPDTRLFLWTLAWDTHALSTAPLEVFDANIFYPERRTLAYSEHQLGNALMALPFFALGTGPLLPLNALLLLSTLGAGLGTYFLARRLGASPAGALAAGVIFAFGPPRFFRLSQLHLATVQWIPVCLAFVHAYAAGGRRWHLLAAVMFFSLQSLTGGQTGLFLALAAGGLLAYLGAWGLVRPRGSRIKDFALAGALLAAIHTPFLMPYFTVREELGLRRSLAEAVEWSPNAVSFLAAPTHAQQWLLGIVPGLDRRVLEDARGFLFPGFLTLILCGVALTRPRPKPRPTPPPPAPSPPAIEPAKTPPLRALCDGLILVLALAAVAIEAAGGVRWQLGLLEISARSGARAAGILVGLVVVRLLFFGRAPFLFQTVRQRCARFVRARAQARPGLEAGYYVLLAALSFWAALGPRFGLYAVLYRLVPGFDFIRVPSRLTLLTLLALAILGGLGVDALAAARRGWQRTVMSAAPVALLVVELSAFPLPAVPYHIAIPAADRWLAGTSEKSAVVELPVPDPRDAVRSAQLHSVYMLHSTAHWRPLVNGYSGFTPPGHDRLFRLLVNFPDAGSLGALEELGVAYAVIHRELYSPRDWARVEQGLAQHGERLRMEYADGDGRVYSLTRSIRPRSDRGR